MLRSANLTIVHEFTSSGFRAGVGATKRYASRACEPLNAYFCSLKELFHITHERGEQGKEKLSLRFGDRHCSYAITDLSGNELYELAYCSVPLLSENELSAFRSAFPRTAEPYHEVQIIYDNAKAVLMPSWCYHIEHSKVLLKAMHGDVYGSHIISEAIPVWQLYNIYCMPLDVQDWINQQYPVSSFRHQYSLTLKNIPATVGGCIFVDFRPEEFTVMVAQGSRLLVGQTYDYSAPEDVIYRLLKICRTFSLIQEEVLLRVSGLVEQQSALYRDLYQYFIHIQFREATWKDSAKIFPPQFFTSLNDLAVCAS